MLVLISVCPCGDNLAVWVRACTEVRGRSCLRLFFAQLQMPVMHLREDKAGVLYHKQTARRSVSEREVVNHLDSVRLQLQFKRRQRGTRTSTPRKYTVLFTCSRSCHCRDLHGVLLRGTEWSESRSSCTQSTFSECIVLKRKYGVWWSSCVWDVNRPSLLQTVDLWGFSLSQFAEI